ncbi:LysR family transcriptional regulator [Photobacterium sanctipauli]|uniref:LysR family transcriptional regulator n=1 Tax=Photobacterium sanctipauli TaxID=1342794 RepID=A0A2T3NVM9_9GAMM|nr:LysR family transcriptional regulator [Photobacterium sanctipauli]PSW20317.1 LysR family transcriptional regulator [Photobacterium sanctipauli]
MDNRALKYFEAVAKAGSIRGASEKLHVAPSAISRKIVQLEDQLHVQLVTRLGRGVTLTEAGKELTQYIKEMQVKENEFLAFLSDMQSMKTGTIRLATGGGFIDDLILNAISRFSKKFPGVQVKLDVCGGDEIIRKLREEQADIGLVLNCPTSPQIDFLHREIFQPLSLVVNPYSEFGQLEQCTGETLDSIPLALLDHSFSIRQIVSQIEDSHGCELWPTLECNSFQALKLFALSGAGGTLLPEVCVDRELKNGSLKAIPITLMPTEQTSVDLIMRHGHEKTVSIEKMTQEIIKGMTVFNIANQAEPIKKELAIT